MKKLAAVFLVLLMALGLAACGTPASESSEEENSSNPEVTMPEQFVTFSFWDWQIGTAGDAANLAKQIKAMGYNGADITFRWTRLEYTRGDYGFRYIDAILDAFAEEDLFLSTSLMFWSIGLPWAEEIEWQKLPDGRIYEFSGRGASPSLSDPDTVKAMTDAFDAFSAHVYERYGDRLFRMHARTSQYGELEYFCDAGGVLDYGEPAIAAFRTYLKSEHPTAEELTQVSGRSFSSPEELDTIAGTELSELFYFDWQMFRQSECLKMSRLFRDIQHENAPGVPFALQVGCIWDEAAVTRRGIVDPWLASQACDILHTDDGPGFPHDFSMDYIDMGDGLELASEIDGLWHPTIQALINAGDTSLGPYQTQAQHMGMKGIKYLNTCNWTGAEIAQYSEALAEYVPNFYNAELREAADPTVAILINTADIIWQKTATTALYQAVFNRLSTDGARQVRFVTDTQLLADPDLLDEIESLYAGTVLNGTYYIREDLGRLLSEKGVTLLSSTDPAQFSVRSEYAAELPQGAVPAFAAA